MRDGVVVASGYSPIIITPTVTNGALKVPAGTVITSVPSEVSTTSSTSNYLNSNVMFNTSVAFDPNASYDKDFYEKTFAQMRIVQEDTNKTMALLLKEEEELKNDLLNSEARNSLLIVLLIVVGVVMFAICIYAVVTLVKRVRNPHLL